MSRGRPRNSHNVRKRILRKLILFLMLVGLPVMLFLFSFHIKQVKVLGNKRYTEDQIKAFVIETKPDTNSVYLYLKYRYFVKPNIPFVEKIDVDMFDRHTVTITVYEKSLAGCVEFMGEYLYFDKDGIIVESSSKRLKNVPLIKGLKFNEVVLNEKLKVQKDETTTNNILEAQTDDTQKEGTEKDQSSVEEQSLKNDELFTKIMHITQMIEKYGLDVDTVSFDNKNEVTLKCGDIKVLLGKKDTYDEVLSDLKNILKEAEGIELAELDMRNYKKGTGYVIGKQKKSTD